MLRVEAEAERGPGRALRAVAFALRFRNGAYAHAAVTESPVSPGPAERLRLFASGGGARVEARGWGGPLCVEGAPGTPSLVYAPALGGPPDPDAHAARHEAAAFLAAVAAGRPAPFSIHDAVDTLRLTERLMERLR